MKTIHAWSLLAGITLLAPTVRGKEIVDVGAHECLVILSRQGADLPKGKILAAEGQIGIQERVFTAGRYELDPKTQSWEKHPLVHVAGAEFGDSGAFTRFPEVGVVTALIGDAPPEGQVLASRGQRGIQREVLPPGSYALNPYAYSVETHPAIFIPPGNVGVVTRLVGDLTTSEFASPEQRGIQREVLAPGYYYLNPYEVSVTHVRTGYRQLTFEGNDAITFPTVDSYPIGVEATIVYGLQANDAPYLVKRYGSEANLVDRVLRPQAEYQIRLAGGDMTAREFVDGEARDRFQQKVQDSLKAALESKNVRVLLVLIRSVDVPDTIRRPIQYGKISEEETLTNRAKQELVTTETQLSEFNAKAHIAVAETNAESARLLTEERARSATELERLESEMQLERARFDAEMARARAEFDARKAKAISDAERVVKEAEAEIEARWIQTLGSPEAYTLFRISRGLPKDLKIRFQSPPPK